MELQNIMYLWFDTNTKVPFPLLKFLDCQHFQLGRKRHLLVRFCLTPWRKARIKLHTDGISPLAKPVKPAKPLAMPKKPAVTETIVDVSFKDAISERYLAYALSTITSRSLPDVRDGLKPVHRRLLYAMLQLKLNPNTGFKKCARVVGDVIGKYHPHGDTAVYDTMVRLAQAFAVRYPLVDGQGNFGSIDGDNAAAVAADAVTTVAAARINSLVNMGVVEDELAM